MTDSQTKHWRLKSRRFGVVVEAPDQFEGWDTLRDRPVEDFGLVVTAEPDESGDPIGIQTARLMSRWGRDDDAQRFVDAAKRAGLVQS